MSNLITAGDTFHQGYREALYRKVSPTVCSERKK